MPAYLIADVVVHDQNVYGEYRRKVLPLIQKHGGRFIVRGGAHEVLEGDWKPQRLVVIDDMGMKQLPKRSGEYLFELIMRRYENKATLMTSNRPVEDWGKLLGDTAAVAAFLDRLLHHAHVLTCGPRSWRTRLQGERSEG